MKPQRPRWRTRLSCGLTLLASWNLCAQVAVRPHPKESVPRPILRADSTLVLVPVSVNDSLNRPVLGLRRENFRIFEDKVEQTPTYFNMEDEPVAVGLVMDTSGSMDSKLVRSRRALLEFLKTTNQADELFLAEFDSSMRLIVPLTHDSDEIEQRIMLSHSQGSTALLDAILGAVQEIKSSAKRRALVIVSDGQDNSSRYTPAQIARLVRESDVLIYGIGFFGSRAASEKVGRPEFLEILAEQTGGRFFEASPANLPNIAMAIRNDLHARYVLGYSPPVRSRDGRYHHIDVKIVSAKAQSLSVHWKRGYRAIGD
jgi:Ca-activated chloride channel family protein